MLAENAGARKCSLASEQEFQQLFSDCELGAMPPFGNLYNLPTFVDQDVTHSENIVINAGTHAEAIRLRYADFARLARPRVVRFGEPPPAEIAARIKAEKARARKKARAKASAKAARKKKARKAKKTRRKAPKRKVARKRSKRKGRKRR